MNCPYCHKQNRPGLLLCEHCGRQLLSMSDYSSYQTRYLKDAASKPGLSGPINYQKARTGYLHQSAFVTLELVDANRKISLKTDGHIMLGRADKEAQWQPTIDLTPYGASDKGVSRIHCDLFFESDQVFVLELGSSNGTRVNGIGIRTGQAQQIYNGDLLELGQLRVKVYFG